MMEQDHGRDALDTEASGELLLFIGVDLGEAHPGFELARRLLELRRHRLAGSAPWRPEVDQQGNVALGGVALEALRVQRHGMAREQGRAATAALAAAGYKLFAWRAVQGIAS